MSRTAVSKLAAGGRLIVLGEDNSKDSRRLSGKERRGLFVSQKSTDAKGLIGSDEANRQPSAGSQPRSLSSPTDYPSRHSITPSRHVKLPTVMRKPSSDLDEDVAVEELESIKSCISRENSMMFETSSQDFGVSQNECVLSFITQPKYNKDVALSLSEEQDHTNKSGMLVQSTVSHSSDKNEVNHDDEYDSEEENKAPTNLLMEFLTCLMSKDYHNASKLCKMILLYEPTNAEALKFQPLIEEKIALDLIPNAEDSNDEISDNDDENTSSASDDEDDSSSSSADDDSEDELQQMLHEDSGVASASEEL